MRVQNRGTRSVPILKLLYANVTHTLDMIFIPSLLSSMQFYSWKKIFWGKSDGLNV